MNTYFIVLSFLVNFSICRDFYVGMFKKNDFLVAQDRLYKERRPFSYNVAKYGRMFTCPITFFRVVDRLGTGNGPRVQITRGGLGKKYLVLQITSSYNYPVSVNIYVGCGSVKITTTKRPTFSSEEVPVGEDNVHYESGPEVAKTAKKQDDGKATALGKVETTTLAQAGNASSANGTATNSTR